MQLADPAELPLVAREHAWRGPGAGTGRSPARRATSTPAVSSSASSSARAAKKSAGCAGAAPAARAALTSAARWWRSAAGSAPPGEPSGARRAAPPAGTRAPTRTAPRRRGRARRCRRAASSSPGRSSGRITHWSSLSGFARRSSGTSPSRSRSSASGEVKQYDDSRTGRGRAARPRSAGAARCDWVRRPTACSRAGSVVGSLSRP